jgi:hypothetical protein
MKVYYNPYDVQLRHASVSQCSVLEIQNNELSIYVEFWCNPSLEAVQCPVNAFYPHIFYTLNIGLCFPM